MALKKSTATYTRPATTTTYTIGDVVSDSATEGEALVFEGVVRSTNGHGEIAIATLVDSVNQTLKGDFQLWLFHTAPAVVNDNVAFAPSDAELANLVNIINFSTGIVGNAGTGADGNVVYFGAPASGVEDAVVFTKQASRVLYGVIVARNAYVPLASSTLTVSLYFK